MAEVFACQRCGHCCAGDGGIVLTDDDLARLSAHLELDAGAFTVRYTARHAGRLCLASGSDGYCIFYDHNLPGCGVHTARPKVCRAWPFFAGNLVDADSWLMIQDDCPGVLPEPGHAAFVAAGLAYRREHGLVCHGPDAPGALRPLHPDEAKAAPTPSGDPDDHGTA